MEAAFHLTDWYKDDPGVYEFGGFAGVDLLQYRYGNFILAPKIGVETVYIPQGSAGFGFAGRFSVGAFGSPGHVNYFVAPEIALNWLTVFEFYYSYRHTDRQLQGYTPHCFGIRMTINFNRAFENAYKCI